MTPRTMADIERTAAERISSGEIGEPVALRVLLTVPRSDDSWGCWLAALDGLFGHVFGGLRGEAAVRLRPATANVMIRGANGRTVSVTLTRTEQEPPVLSLVLVGNIGISRLDQVRCAIAPQPGSRADAWDAALAKSGTGRVAVP